VWVASEHRRHANPRAGEAALAFACGQHACGPARTHAGRPHGALRPRLYASPARRVAIPRGVEVIGPLAARPLGRFGLVCVRRFGTVAMGACGYHYKAPARRKATVSVCWLACISAVVREATLAQQSRTSSSQQPPLSSHVCVIDPGVEEDRSTEAQLTADETSTQASRENRAMRAQRRHVGLLERAALVRMRVTAAPPAGVVRM
jgi:hypothetical protein